MITNAEDRWKRTLYECYLINSLNEEIEKYTELRYNVDRETGLIANSFSEVGIFLDC